MSVSVQEFCFCVFTHVQDFCVQSCPRFLCLCKEYVSTSKYDLCVHFSMAKGKKKLLNNSFESEK